MQSDPPVEGARGGTADEDWTNHGEDPRFSLGEPAKDAYMALASGQRASVNQRSQELAELTIPSTFPPETWQPGEPLPGNNQSVGAACVRTLASKLMFMAFPPGQPIAKLEPVIPNLQQQIDQDPEMYSAVLLALSQLEQEHRRRFSSTPLDAAYERYMALLVVAGNALWKHIKLNEPTVHSSRDYVVSRSRSGHPLVTIHRELVRVATLPDDVQEMILARMPREEREKKGINDWTREAEIYSVCKLQVDGEHEDDWSWLYWQEYEGEMIPDSEVETDYDDCPMWAGWMIPRYGYNWGESYCSQFQGDLYTAEAAASGLNDGAAAASWMLAFVKPGARTSLNQVKRAKNLSVLPGSAEDLTFARTEKAADLQIVESWFNSAARRLGAGFLMDSATRREGERVTAEEVQRVGRELDQGMGGLYTQIAKSDQRRIIMRAIRLHEEENKKLPPIPRGVVSINVVTGMDAMGRSAEAQNLIGFATTLGQIFGPAGVTRLLSGTNFSTRLAAAMAIKPDGLVQSDQQQEAAQSKAFGQSVGADVASKAAGPLAGALAEHLTGLSAGGDASSMADAEAAE